MQIYISIFRDFLFYVSQICCVKKMQLQKYFLFSTNYVDSLWHLLFDISRNKDQSSQTNLIATVILIYYFSFDHNFPRLIFLTPLPRGEEWYWPNTFFVAWGCQTVMQKCSKPFDFSYPMTWDLSKNFEKDFFFGEGG